MLFFFSPLKSQQSLPETISVVYYIGGDVRGEDFIGAYDNKDSLVYTINTQSKGYFSYKSYHTHRVLPFKDGNFKSNINQDSTITSHFKDWVSSEDIENLLLNIDTSWVVPFYWSDSTSLNPDGNGSRVTRINKPVYFPYDLSIDYFLADTTLFKGLYAYYNQEAQSRGEPIRNDAPKVFNYDHLLKYIVKRNTFLTNISSYYDYVKITLKWSNNKGIQLFQNYPGNLNVTWKISGDIYVPEIFVFNPEINNVIARLMPKSLKYSRYLKNYNNPEVLSRIIRFNY